MRNLTATICLTLAVLLGSAGMSWSAEPIKGYCLPETEHVHSPISGKCSVSYEKGDYGTALRKFRPLADKGIAAAQYNLAQMYFRGQGVPQDHKTAAKWYKLAAEQGYASAQDLLGNLYSFGKGVPQDYKTAMKWYTLAAEQGYASAQSSLGGMYRFGQGVPQDYKTAVKWYRLAAEQGDADARALVEYFQEKIARENPEEAERIAREKREKLERIAKEKRIKAREKQSASNPGFRELKPGLHRSTINEKKICRDSLVYVYGTTCYDLDNLKFRGIYDNQGHLTRLTVDIGPIIEMSGGAVDRITNYIERGETNIFLKMDSNLRKKYVRNFTYSERDRQFFNVGQMDNLLTVYEKGSVALRITRKVAKFSHQELWLLLEYRDKQSAKIFFNNVKPKRAKASDY